MEKISLKPIARELLFKSEEPNTHCDVASFSGTNNQEKGLGSLFLISHIKYEHEDLGYVISLLSSLARREYYCADALKSQDARQAFEGTLQKLNEVLKDFFTNKQFSLNIGLAAIAGEKIFISKLGKFKVGLARAGEHIDVLNNLMLFHKSDEDAQQFSNVISGTLQPGDKLFAYYPTRSLTSRERVLQAALIRDDQSAFTQKVTDLAETANNFACCGIHINLEQIKEIPLESVPVSIPTVPAVSLASTKPFNVEEEKTNSEPAPVPIVTQYKPLQADTRPKVIAAELERGNRTSRLSAMGRSFANLASFRRLAPRLKARNFIIIAVIIIVPLLAVVAFRGGDSGAAKAAYKNATAALAQAQGKIAQHDERSARTLIASTLADISAFNTKNIDIIKGQLQSSLNNLDHVSSTTPQPAQLDATVQSGLDATKDDPVHFITSTYVAGFNGNDAMHIYSFKSKTAKTYKLKNATPAVGGALYEGNLYTVADGHIYKYTDAVLGSSPRIEWSKETLEGTPLAIAVDGDAYILTKGGKLNNYFVGKQKQSFDLGIPPADGARLLTNKDAKNIYVVDISVGKIYSFAKDGGTLVATYKIDGIGAVNNAVLSSDGTILIFTSDAKVWSLTP